MNKCVTVEWFRAERVGTYPHKRERWITIKIQEERPSDSAFILAEALYREHSRDGNALVDILFDSLPRNKIDALMQAILASYHREGQM